MNTRKKMICPECEVEMNFHAEKINYNIDPPSKTADVFGGTVEEVYTCAHCGQIEVRAEE
jgi:hypothetical protein